MKYLRLLALLLVLPLTGLADDDLGLLLDGGQLSIDSSISPATALVPGQRARLDIEVATNTWFTGGTRIRIPEVPGLVILQTEQFAANTSEQRNGQTWVVQRWTLDVYPQQAGIFEVPAIELTIQVNGGELGNLQGQALAPPLSFEVTVPPALEQADFWVAAPRFSVSQQLDRDTDALAPGDAFERRIEFRGDDVLAMMLPDFSEERLPGLAAYPAPPELENCSNRGQASASRVQRISYVAEKPGDYLLPAQDFFWWDTRNGELRVLSLEAVSVQVQGDPASAAAPERRIDRRSLLRGLGLVASGIVIIALLLRFRPWRLLGGLAGPAQRLSQQIKALRRPALPRRLNPGNSAGD